ncbi:NAD-dependent epimerase/dehydratase family protein [Paraburkholderia megapolitana]|uniref:Nucleoside-diphosphate-sugar epimerase n=1 Tax=Paraburkholderia megapolitana TaxID=420953 RepID=A0A1I3GLK4_9BURK|nr:NAD-dependent epimerase/dehydratase family protein [Paraburkholderia megapolitana]QDQ82959.1 NAD-dependent epimerase/dehydratase family protein [Paraburkholderia megapolitana]SFI24357.1 Nucleoside-diphosphate-sugar epimerase [Paraburkholderia megapolitana]
MKLFMTGGTGFIGQAVARKAISLGHQVTALVREDSSAVAGALVRLGVTLHSGDLREPQSFAATAGAADGVVHVASTNDASAAAVDEAAALAILAHLRPGAAFVYTSGTWVYGNTDGEPATEASALNPTPLIAWRPAVEQQVLALAARRSIGAVILRPAMVYGYGGGVFGMLAGMARQTGSVRVIGDGRNHWPAVHVDDLAAAYVSAVERAASGDDRVAGQIFNVVAEDAVAVAAIGEAIRVSVGADRVEPWPLDDARQSFGPFADALALDQTVSGQHARQVLAWKPHSLGLIADLSVQKHFQQIDGA